MKRKYIKPATMVVPIEASAVICHSYGEGGIGNPTPEFDAAPYRRGVDWEEYEKH